MKKRVYSQLVAGFLFLVSTMGALGQFPTDIQFTKVNMPTGMPKPAYLVPYTDPVYGTSVVCISDETVFGPTQAGTSDWWAPYRRHRWFKMQPWNADGTKILIDLTYPNYLVDGKTYKFIKRYDPNKPQIHPPSEAVWSNTDPNLMYGVSGNTFLKFNVNTGVRTTLHTFSNFNNISLGNFEGNVSNDDKYVALWCPKGTKYSAVVYDIKKDSVLATFDLGVQGKPDYYETFGLNWLCISQTGKYVVIQWQRSGKERAMGVEIFDNKMNFIRQACSTVKNAYNIDMGLDANGDDVLVYQDLSNCDINTHRLKDGLVKKVLDGSKISKATTISCRNVKRPGWAYFGDFEAGARSVAEFHSAGLSDKTKASYNTVFALKLDGSEMVEVFGHMHHSSNEGLYLQPMPVPSPDGKKVMFASDWEEEDMSTTSVGGPFKYTRVYNYVAEYLAPTIPQDIVATDLTSESFKMVWKSSLDDNTDAIYEVFKDGVSIGTTSDTTMNITGLKSETIYTMTVKASDAKGNTSPSSQELKVSTYKTGVGTVSVQNNIFEVNFYPNPMKDKGTITINASITDDFMVSIHDLAGRKIYEKQFKNSGGESIEIDAFPQKSIYFLKVVNSKNQVVVKKIVQI